MRTQWRANRRFQGRMLIAAVLASTMAMAALGVPQAVAGTTSTSAASDVAVVRAEAAEVGLRPSDTNDLAGPSDSPSYNGLAATPPMGFLSWHRYGCAISQDIMTANADALVSTGLRDLGYQYVVADDCWMDPTRDADGQLRGDARTFPDGMKALAGHVHDNGLKFGLYSAIGSRTCQSRPASYGHYGQDARTFASWGVDYLKLDACGGIPSADFPGKTTEEIYHTLYANMSQALLDSGRPMVFSESAPASFVGNPASYAKVMSWIGSTGNLWRSTLDITGVWSTVFRNYEGNVKLGAYAGPGHWNDPDMLMVGDGHPGTASLPLTEQQTQFSLWSIMAAPLFVSTDLTKISPSELAILSNKDVIAVDQDPYGAQGTLVRSERDQDVLAKPLADGSVAVVLFNKSVLPATITTTTDEVGFIDNAPAYVVKDLWSKKTTETSGTIRATVPGHGAAMFRIRPGQPTDAAPFVNVDLTVAPFQAGASTVTATLHNFGRIPAQQLNVDLSLPEGTSIVRTSDDTADALAPGEERNITWSVDAPSLASGAHFPVDVEATYSWPQAKSPANAEAHLDYILPYVADYPSIQAAFNNVGITDNSNTRIGNFDGFGNSYSAQALSAVGVNPGDTIDVAGVPIIWPDVPAGTPDNVAGGGRSIAFSGAGNYITFLGANGGASPGLTGAITYTDGTVEPFSLVFPNWGCSGGPAGAVIATRGRNTQAGPANLTCYYNVFSQKVPLYPQKDIAVVTLPESSSVHVFGMATSQ